MRFEVTTVLLFAAAACASTPTAPAAPAAPAASRARDRLTLAILTGLAGQTAPCARAAEGRLERLATLLAQRERPTALLVVGETFYQDLQDAAGAETVAQALAQLGPLAVVPGPAELAARFEAVEALAASHGLPLRAQIAGAAAQRVVVGDLTIGLVVVDAPASAQREPLEIASSDLRGAGAEIVVALIPAADRSVRAFLRGVRGVDVAVTGGGPGSEPRYADETLVVDAGQGGEQVGLLHLYPGAGGWRYVKQRRDSRSGAQITWELLPICPPPPVSS